MALGEGLRGIPEKERTQDLLFSGCMSRVWMRLEEKDGRLSLRTDSDTLILRGILFLLEDLLDERTCAEVGSAKIDLFREMDLESVFNGTRKKGMGSLVSRSRNSPESEETISERRKGMEITPLKREEICRVIEGKGRAERIPLLYDIWIYDNVFGYDAARREKWLSSKPCDVDEVFLQMPGTAEGYPEDPDFYWRCLDLSRRKKEGWTPGR